MLQDRESPVRHMVSPVLLCPGYGSACGHNIQGRIAVLFGYPDCHIAGPFCSRRSSGPVFTKLALANVVSLDARSALPFQPLVAPRTEVRIITVHPLPGSAALTVGQRVRNELDISGQYFPHTLLNLTAPDSTLSIAPNNIKPRSYFLFTLGFCMSSGL